MASEEFISLGATCEAEAKDEEEGNLQTERLSVNGVEPLASEHQLEGEPTISNMDNTKASDEIIDLEEGQVEDMDLADDDVVVLKDQLLDASAQSENSVAAVQSLHGVSVELDKGDGPENALIHPSNNILIDKSPTRGVKRARVESTEPSVRVIYKNLTRERTRKLMELMQQWSEWQARKQSTLTEDFEEVLECGEETYYPALHVGSEKSCAVVVPLLGVTRFIVHVGKGSARES